MVNLQVEYMGLKLKNPLIVGASPMSSDIKTAKQLEQAGASALVYRSLFEEQIQMERAQLADELDIYSDRNAEMISLFPALKHSGPEKHLLNIKQLKENLNIPVIASLNCMYDVTWYEYAKLLEETGVDALELNFYSVIDDIDKTPENIETERIRIVETLASRLNIPFSIKLSPYYTNILNFVSRMDKAGAKAFVLFNRLFQPEIDIESEAHLTNFNLSKRGNFRVAMRYIGILNNKINADLCANNGIYNSVDIIQMLLSGANTVQLVSTLYKNQADYLKTLLRDIEIWMKSKGYKSIEDFRGKLSDSKIKTTETYYRAQYLDYLLRPEEIINKYPMR
ncbi:MAG: dihydroorotate dehydrogenase-like protein [Marinifilaceae bacterium]|jgi:dihydroorotate dehydrogenase (fumarate)|nr:dihydroorotate dehydrogenase-like protein [Marinifilaceae bacterium]